MEILQRFGAAFTSVQLKEDRFALSNQALKRIVAGCATVIGIYTLFMCLTLPPSRAD